MRQLCGYLLISKDLGDLEGVGVGERKIISYRTVLDQ